MFGYGADNDGNWSHYWEKPEDKNQKTGIHPGREEYEIIQKLDKLKKLKFYTGFNSTVFTEYSKTKKPRTYN